MDINKVKEDLRHVANINGLDDETETPDFILAELLMDALISYRRTRKNTDEWKGRPAWRPGQRLVDSAHAGDGGA